MTPERPKPRKMTLPVKDLVPIVNDALMAGPVGDGKQIPLVILDTTERPDVDEMIRVHRSIALGTVGTAWAVVEGKPNDIILMLAFERPVELRVVLRIGIEERGGLIDLALAAGAIYLQAGRPGDRLSHDLNRAKILVDLVDTGFSLAWEDTFLNRMTTVFSRRMGITPRKARPFAREFIAMWRQMGSFRMPALDDGPPGRPSEVP